MLHSIENVIKQTKCNIILRPIYLKLIRTNVQIKKEKQDVNINALCSFFINKLLCCVNFENQTSNLQATPTFF